MARTLDTVNQFTVYLLISVSIKYICENVLCFMLRYNGNIPYRLNSTLCQYNTKQEICFHPDTWLMGNLNTHVVSEFPKERGFENVTCCSKFFSMLCYHGNGCKGHTHH